METARELLEATLGQGLQKTLKNIFLGHRFGDAFGSMCGKVLWYFLGCVFNASRHQCVPRFGSIWETFWWHLDDVFQYFWEARGSHEHLCPSHAKTYFSRFEGIRFYILSLYFPALDGRPPLATLFNDLSYARVSIWLPK